MFEHTVPSDWFPRCAIFDCDGILLDSETVWNDVQRELFARWSVPFTEEVEHRLTGLAAADVAEELALPLHTRRRRSEAGHRLRRVRRAP